MAYLLTCALIIAQVGFVQTSESSYQANWRPYVNAPSQHDSDLAWSISHSRSLGNLSPARFLSIDRLAEKFPAFSPYTYSANNPVLFVDPTGDSVNVASIQQYDNNNKTSCLNSIEGDLAGQTGLTLSTSSSGQLVFAVDAKGNPVIATDANGNQVGSADARALLISAISS